MIRLTNYDVAPIGTELEEFAALDDDVVDDAVGLRLLCGEPTVSLGIDFDLVDGLTCVERDALGHETLDVRHLFGLNRDVRGLTLNTAKRLMHHDAGVRKRVALARSSGAQKELTH